MSSRINHEASDAAAPRSDLWKSILDSVSTTTPKPARHVLLLGSSARALTQFVEGWRSCSTLPGFSIQQHAAETPIPSTLPGATTYFDLEDADHDETLCRITFHLFPRAEAGLDVLIRSIMLQVGAQELSVCIVLDWHEPWHWLVQLRGWFKHLEAALDEAKLESQAFADAIASQTKAMEQTVRGYTDSQTGFAASHTQQDLSLLPPLAQNQLDRPLGLPLFCVAQNTHHLFKLETDLGMNDEQFDFIQQTLRLLMMSHGGSLFYTAPAQPATTARVLSAFLQQVLQSTATQKLQRIAASVIEKDQAALPLGWDTPVKIDVHRDDFGQTSMATGWRADLDHDEQDPALSAVMQYAQRIPNAQARRLLAGGLGTAEDDFVAMESHEAFLTRLEQRFKDQKNDAAQQQTTTPVLTTAQLEDRLNRLRQQPVASVERDMGDSSTASAYFKSLMERRTTRGTPQ